MTLTTWSPVRDLAQLQDRINRAFIEATPRGGDEGLMNRGTWIPPVDIYQNGNHELVLKVELPEIKREDIKITIDNDTLTISGEKKPADDVKDEQFHRIERVYGAFSRSFQLPPMVDVGKIAAEYKDGVLTMRLPLREEAKPRQIEVQIAA
jgi:HSP20 family protein